MILEEEKRYTIVTRREYFPLLFSFKNSNPSLNIKIIDKKDYLQMISFSFKKDPIPFLIAKGIDYSQAKKYVNIFVVGDVAKNKKIEKLFNEIPKDYFSFDEYGLLEIERGNLLFLEMKNDYELHSITKRKNLSFQDISFSDLGIKEQKEKHSPIIYFQNKFSQYFYLYSQLRKRIAQNPLDKDRIHLLISDEADIFFLNFTAKAFHLPTMVIEKRPFISLPEIKDKVKKIFENQSFDFTEEEINNPNVAELKKIVEFYGLDKLVSFSFAYANLLEILSSMSFVDKNIDNGIIASNDFAIDQNSIIYVTNFKHDVFYHIESDKDVISDKELYELGVNPSYIKTAIDRDLKLNYLKYNNIVLLSRVRQHLSEKIFDSEFIEEFSWKDDIELFNNDSTGIYTNDSKNLYLTNQLDKAFYKERYDLIRSYDHSFKGIEAKIYPDGNTYSLTKLENYIRCPFQFLLNFLIPPNDSDPHSRLIGTLIHSMFENIMHKDYNFEKDWEEASNNYRNSFDGSGFKYSSYDDVLLEIIKARLEKIIAVIRRHNSNMNLVEKEKDAELKIPFEIKYNGKKYSFNGKIDKIIISSFKEEGKEDDEKIYYTIVDYKTGNEKFILTNTFLGTSVQLPLYYYALTKLDLNDEDNKYFKNLIGNKAIFGGFGIQTVYAYSPKSFFGDNKDAFLRDEYIAMNTKLIGLSLNSTDYYFSYDFTSITDKKEIKRFGGEYLAKRKTFASTGSDAKENIINSKSSERFNLQDMLNDSQISMAKTIEAINRCEFPIKPAPSHDLSSENRDESACGYCLYKDVCYHSPNDFKSYKDEINEHYHIKKGAN